MIRIKLENSLNVFTNIIKDTGYIHFKLCFKSGLIYEPENKRGITHLLEHMLFRGAGKYNYEDLEKCFRNMGTEIYGKTGYDYMSLSFSVLSTKINAAILYLKEIFTPPLWTNDDLKKEKEIIKHEIALKDTKLSRRIRTVYDNELLNKSVLGCTSVIDKISLDELLQYYSKTITAANTFLFVSGDISENDYNELIGFLSNIDNQKETELKTETSLVPYTAFKRNQGIFLEYDYFDYSDLFIHFDVKKQYQEAARFIQHYLSGYTSPLSELLIDREALSYELYSYLDEWKEFSILIFEISCKYNSLCKTIDKFRVALNSIIYNFTEKDYKEALAFIELENQMLLSNPEKANELNFKKYFYGISDNTPDYHRVCEAMNSIFSKENLTVYSTYSVKRKDVYDAVYNLKESLNSR